MKKRKRKFPEKEMSGTRRNTETARMFWGWRETAKGFVQHRSQFIQWVGERQPPKAGREVKKGKWTSVGQCSKEQMEQKLSRKPRKRGCLGDSGVEHLPLAQVMILGSWDQVLHWAPCEEYLPLPVSLPLSVCLS